MLIKNIKHGVIEDGDVKNKPFYYIGTFDFKKTPNNE
jgi:hypothetical protein